MMDNDRITGFARELARMRDEVSEFAHTFTDKSDSDLLALQVEQETIASDASWMARAIDTELLLRKIKQLVAGMM